jgi:hypothetical protein
MPRLITLCQFAMKLMWAEGTGAWIDIDTPAVRLRADSRPEPGLGIAHDELGTDALDH